LCVPEILGRFVHGMGRTRKDLIFAETKESTEDGRKKVLKKSKWVKMSKIIKYCGIEKESTE
jgi:hypothetical protein